MTEPSEGATAPVTIGIAIPVPEPYGSQLRTMRAAFGDPMAETQRLVTQRDLIAASSALAHELESFAKAAAAQDTRA